MRDQEQALATFLVVALKCCDSPQMSFQARVVMFVFGGLLFGGGAVVVAGNLMGLSSGDSRTPLWLALSVDWDRPSCSSLVRPASRSSRARSTRSRLQRGVLHRMQMGQPYLGDMLRRVAGWLDLRRGFASLAGAFLGISVAAWSENSPEAGVGLGFASVIVAAFMVRAYRTPDRIEVPDLGSVRSTRSAEGNVHVLPADSE